MATECRTEGCTVEDTGICLLANDPDTCEFRIRRDDRVDDGELEDETPPVLDTPEDKPTLWGSLPLELNEVRQMMAARRCLLVGVLGTPAAGKTAALVSMYLLLSHGKLAGFQFAGSNSLLAFEEICHGARRWGESPPEEMTERTRLSSGRAAGFLHTQLRRLSDNRLIDLLIPDLPGEWSDGLIDTNRTDRLEFLKAADVIWLFVNGADLRANETRMHTLSRTKRLLTRVSDMLGLERPPIKIVVSHADAGDLPEATHNKLIELADEIGVSVAIVNIASFADPAAHLSPGYGISPLIDVSVPIVAPERSDWPSKASTSARFMLRYERAGDI